jgi:hypothetical protein
MGRRLAADVLLLQNPEWAANTIGNYLQNIAFYIYESRKGRFIILSKKRCADQVTKRPLYLIVTTYGIKSCFQFIVLATT